MTIETVEQVVGLLTEHPVSEITVERGSMRIFARRGVAPPGAASVPADAVAFPESSASIADTALPTASSIVDGTEPLILLAPMVGLFHHLPAPVRYGMNIAAGQVVGAIESMKLMNDVLSEYAGQVVEVLVEDGGAVEYGRPLFRLAP